MKEIKFCHEKSTLEISKEELVIMCNALNEVCNGFNVLDFEMKIGTTEENALKFLKSLSGLYKKANFERFNYM
jgi:hypothetical protein